MLRHNRIRRFVCCWLLLSGVRLAPLWFWGSAESQVVSARIEGNSNQTSGGTMTASGLTMNLEVREGEWFPEDEHGPSVKVFALAEKGKPLQIPGPMIRVRQGTVIHLHLQNLISATVIMHGMHSRPGKQ